MRNWPEADGAEFLKPRSRTLSLLSRVSDVSFWTVRHGNRQPPIWSSVATVGGSDPSSACRIVPVGGHMALYRASRRDASRAMADAVSRGCSWYVDSESDSPPPTLDPRLPTFSSLRELRMKAEVMGMAGKGRGRPRATAPRTDAASRAMAVDRPSRFLVQYAHDSIP